MKRANAGGGVRPSAAAGPVRERRVSEPGPDRPPPPPSPSISHLTPEEIQILQSVFKKQEDFEKSHDSYARSLELELQTLENRVRQQAAQKSKLKQYDLRLCRLCFKTKFADCIGRVCHDCHRRVCNKCGSFVLAKNKQSNKGRWRCYLCRKRREYACLTGVWFHGNEGKPSIDSSDFRRKLSDIINWVETEWEHSDVNFSGSELAELRPSARDAKTDSELATLGERSLNVQNSAASPRSCRRLVRRRTTSSGTDHEPEEEEEHFVDANQFMQERRKCRRERLEHQRRANRRRSTRRGSAPFILSLDDSESNLDLSPDGRSQTSSMSEASGSRQTQADFSGRYNEDDPRPSSRQRKNLQTPPTPMYARVGGSPQTVGGYRDRMDRERERSDRERDRDRVSERYERERERDRLEREREWSDHRDRDRDHRDRDRDRNLVPTPSTMHRTTKQHRRASPGNHQMSPDMTHSASRERHSRSENRRPQPREVNRSLSTSVLLGSTHRSPSAGRRHGRSTEPSPITERDRKYSHPRTVGGDKPTDRCDRDDHRRGAAASPKGASGGEKHPRAARRPSADASCQISEGDAPLAVLQRQQSFGSSSGGEPKLLAACKKHGLIGNASPPTVGGGGLPGIVRRSSTGAGHKEIIYGGDIALLGAPNTQMPSSRDGLNPVVMPRSPDGKHAPPHAPLHASPANRDRSRDKCSISPLRKSGDYSAEDESPRRRLPRQQSLTTYASTGHNYDEDQGYTIERHARRSLGSRPPLVSQTSLNLPRRPCSPPTGANSVLLDWDTVRRKSSSGAESMSYEHMTNARERRSSGDHGRDSVVEYPLERRVSGQSSSKERSNAGSRDNLAGEDRTQNASPSRGSSSRRRYSAGSIRSSRASAGSYQGLPFHRQNSSGPFTVILHRDPEDTSCRTSGLGMRIMGGKMTPDGVLGTFVTNVIKGGPADQSAIRPGDQLLEWCGQSLEDATFEEVREIMDRSGETVQLVVLHTGMEFNGEKSEGCNDTKNIPQWHQNSETRRSVRDTAVTAATVGTTNTSTVPMVAAITTGSGLHVSGSRTTKRLLPKIPDGALGGSPRLVTTNEVEVNHSEDRGISGRVKLQLRHSMRETQLIMRLVQCEGLSMRDNEEPPHPYVKVYVLPDRRRFTMMRTLPKPATREPIWNAKFVFDNVSSEELPTLAVEITVWDWVAEGRTLGPVFLGEVLLDLTNACLDGNDVWYPLEEHDENSGPLPIGGPSECDQSEMVEASGGGGPGGGAHGRSTWRSLPSLPRTPAYDRAKKLLDKRPPQDPRYSEGRTDNLVLPAEVSESSPQLYKRRISPASIHASSDEGGDPSKNIPASTSNPEDLSTRNGGTQRCRPTLKVRMMRQMSDAVNKVSAKLADKRSHSLDSSSGDHKGSSLKVPEEDTERRHSASAIMGTSRRKMSCTTPPINLELLAAPMPVSRSSSQSSGGSRYISSGCNDTDIDDMCYSPTLKFHSGGEDHFVPPAMGPGQVTPKRSFYDDVNGPPPATILLGLAISKGQMEVDIIKARGVITPKAPKTPPDTYVKLCLLDGTRRLQQKKTKIVKESTDPIYHQQIKYPACNIHGRHLQVQVKEKSGRFEKSLSLGEVVIRLDSLDLSRKMTGWYRLFRHGEVEVGSTESLHIYSP